MKQYTFLLQKACGSDELVETITSQNDK